MSSNYPSQCGRVSQTSLLLILDKSKDSIIYKSVVWWHTLAKWESNLPRLYRHQTQHNIISILGEVGLHVENTIVQHVI